MKKHFLPLAAMILLGSSSLCAQDDSAQQKAAIQEKARGLEEQARAAQSAVDAAQQQVRDIQERMKTLDRKDGKLGEYDEIIIKRKDDKDEKITIEIKNDNVIINGKPLDEFVNDVVSVQVRSPRRYELIAPASPFRYPRSSWSLEKGNIYNGNNGNGAFLGVMTEAASNGAKVTAVTEKSAAAKAGLKKDDVITRINDQSISSPQQLSEVVSGLKPDDKVKITYLRDGKENKATAKLGKRTMSVRSYGRTYIGPNERPEVPEIPEIPEAPEAPEAMAPLPALPRMQLNFDDLGDRFQRSFNFDGKPRIGIRVQDTDDGKGAKVVSVDDGSAAEKAGLKPDDIITSFDGKPVNGAGELADATRAANDKSSVKIQLKRDGKNKDIELKIPRKLRTADL